MPTMNSNETISFICSLFNLSYTDFESITCSNTNGLVSAFVKLKNKYDLCPKCSYPTPKVHGYYQKQITHSALTNRACTLFYNARRFKCPLCNKTYFEHSPFTHDKQKISTLTITNILSDLKSPNETFTGVAKRYNISPTSVQSIFDTHIVMARSTLPQYLCIDEVYAFKSRNSKYVCVLVDFLSHDVIDVLPSRHQHELYAYFHSIPLEERERVLLFSTDMWETYRRVGQDMFPNAKVCVDHFHVMQELQRCIDRIRVRCMKGYSSNSKKYYLLKKFSWTLYSNDDTSLNPNKEKKWNRRLYRWVNFYDIRKLILDEHRELDEAINLRDAYVHFHETSSLESAPKDILPIIEGFKSASAEELRSFANTLINWQQEIINAFTPLYNANGEVLYLSKEDKKKEQHISNGIIENRNKIIKMIKHNANGYRNWDRFRKRVIYCLNKEKSYRLNPDKQALSLKRTQRHENYIRFRDGKTKKRKPKQASA